MKRIILRFRGRNAHGTPRSQRYKNIPERCVKSYLCQMAYTEGFIYPKFHYFPMYKMTEPGMGPDYSLSLSGRAGCIENVTTAVSIQVRNRILSPRCRLVDSHRIQIATGIIVYAEGSVPADYNKAFNRYFKLIAQGDEVVI